MLIHLSTDGCELDICDIKLFSPNKENKHCLLPCLTSVTMDLYRLGDYADTVTSMFKTTWQELTNLSLCNTAKKVYREVVSLINSGHVPSLT